ncbi:MULTISPECIES: glycosyltransferase family 4 protein [unclassified Flavobacterium]|uniref:glycosyltransferase family 4 protein n=1 Tax=unclassified Flavobacterium TaxID=196869 RepID=UPI003F931E6F
MKLLYLVPNCNTEGGVARVLSIKTNYLIEKCGYEIHILTQNNGNSKRFYNFNSKIIFQDMILDGNSFQFLKKYQKNLKQHISIVKPDVIIVCDNGLKAFTVPFILNTNIPLLFECHGSKYIQENNPKNSYLSQGFDFLKYKFKDFSVQKFDFFIALSEESLQEWKVSKATVIPNPSWITTTTDNLLEKKKVITVARNSFEKGLDRLLSIWQKITVLHPDWVLEIYGDGLEPLTVLAETLQISSSVSFNKSVVNIEEKYKDASLYVMTSRSEGFPMVLIEAMASGLPCIAYDCPVGPRAIISNNENGFLIENGNESQFVDQLSLLMRDAVLRKELGNNAAETAAKYDLDKIMLQWKTLFETVIKKN